jgi:hypothetical protein
MVTLMALFNCGFLVFVLGISNAVGLCLHSVLSFKYMPLDCGTTCGHKLS